MEYKHLSSINLEGLGTHTGGEFDRITISGQGKITSDVVCQILDISGASILQGNVDEIREEKGKSIDTLFREVFVC